MGHLVTEQIETIDLVVQHNLDLVVEAGQELSHWLRAIRVPVVDSLETGHAVTLPSLVTSSHGATEPTDRPNRADGYAAAAIHDAET